MRRFPFPRQSGGIQCRRRGKENAIAMSEPPETGTIKLHNWHDFTKVMKIMGDGRWIFRGHKSVSYHLEVISKPRYAGAGRHLTGGGRSDCAIFRDVWGLAGFSGNAAAGDTAVQRRRRRCPRPFPGTLRQQTMRSICSTATTIVPSSRWSATFAGARTRTVLPPCESSRWLKNRSAALRSL